jgi:hypothetical protein
MRHLILHEANSLSHSQNPKTPKPQNPKTLNIEF